MVKATTRAGLAIMDRNSTFAATVSPEDTTTINLKADADNGPHIDHSAKIEGQRVQDTYDAWKNLTPKQREEARLAAVAASAAKRAERAKREAQLAAAKARKARRTGKVRRVRRAFNVAQ